ncbi:I78 family peptidase inhibitor [Phenylobacterium sp. J367]|uniref:I78 family peptidase inhibitor n=1 Tax=Phenylobacterium sp. J367 TaxID=2898435 RepID=UPI0021515E84|nr:I78 family peptidase inhibitor [Phenylobacterium sp. J367]MCR5880308.1 peptidase inhibitor I78 [Phenylobacterium sp. J367]
MTKRFAILGVLALAACAAPAEPPPPPAPPPPPPPVLEVRDQCGAAALQHLVGQPRSKIPVPVNPATQRVACTTCPVTQDFSPNRLNFFFDAESGLIREIRCG